MKVVIADDEVLARKLLRELVSAHSDVEVVGEAADGEDLVRIARETDADLVLTDIDMPGIDGLGAAFVLSHLGGPDIIFVTAYDRHATSAFDMDAIDYVLKPVRRHRLDQALDRARRRFAAKQAIVQQTEFPPTEGNHLWVQTNHRLLRVELSEIDRVEAAGDHLYLHCGDRTYLHRMTMKDFEALAERTELRRVHRSIFVRVALISAIDRRGRSTVLTLTDGTIVPVGPNYRSVLSEVLSA